MKRKRLTMRDRMRPVIAEAISEGRATGLEGRELLALIRTRKTYEARVTSSGYKVWLDELRIQLGRRKPRDGTPARKPDLPGQGLLFVENS